MPKDGIALVRTGRIFAGSLAVTLLALLPPSAASAQEPAAAEAPPSVQVPTPEGAKTAADEGPRYEILLERGARKGDRFELTSEARILRSESVIEGEEEIEPEGQGEGKVHLEATATVLGVNSEGGITEASYEVKSFTGTFDGVEVEAFAAGSVLEMEAVGGQTQIVLRDGELSPKQLLLLVQVLETAREGEPGDDDLFGTGEPQAVGGVWPVHPEAVVAAFSANGTQVTAGAVSGGSRLVAARTVDGVECLRIEGRLDITEMNPPGIDETAFANARMTLEYTGNYPIDNVSLTMDGRILSRLEIRHSLFEPEEEGDLPIYHLRIHESDKKFSIRPLEKAPEPDPATGASSPPPVAEGAAKSPM